MSELLEEIVLQWHMLKYNSLRGRSLPGLSCKHLCSWMGNIPCAPGRESGGQAGVIPSHWVWRCIHNGVSAVGNSYQAWSCGCCVFAGVGAVWWDVLCCSHPWWCPCDRAEQQSTTHEAHSPAGSSDQGFVHRTFSLICQQTVKTWPWRRFWRMGLCIRCVQPVAICRSAQQ